MDVTQEDSTAFELDCIDWGVALGDTEECSDTSTTEMNISSGSLLDPTRTKPRSRSSKLNASLDAAQFPCPSDSRPSAAPKEDHVLPNAHYPSPQRSSESVEQSHTSKARSREAFDTAAVDDKDDETDSDEHIRLIKHRAVNRRTAAKARQRDKVQTAALEKSFEDETARNPALKRTIVSLHEELCNLQMEALQHVNCNCTELQHYNRKRVRKISQCWELN